MCVCDLFEPLSPTCRVSCTEYGIAGTETGVTVAAEAGTEIEGEIEAGIGIGTTAGIGTGIEGETARGTVVGGAARAGAGG